MTKTRTRAAAAVALAALAVGATACGSSHGPTSIKAALAQKPPRVPTHDTGISGAEQKDLAPLPRKVRDEIVFSGVRFSTREIRTVRIATPEHGSTLSAKIIEGAGEKGWGCVTTSEYPILPKKVFNSLAKEPPIAQLLRLVPGLRGDTQGLALTVGGGENVVAIATIPLGGKNQAIVAGLFAPTGGGTWHVESLTAGKVTQCG
jgi:hypothetical protein